MAPDDRSAETGTNVVRSVQDEHAALREQLRALEREIDSARGSDGAAIAAQLQALRSAVSQHFQSEEHDGLFDTLTKDEPRLANSVRRLIAEHRAIEQSTEVLISTVRLLPAIDDGFKQSLHAWIHRLWRHEIDEEDLISEATTRDLGLGD